MLCIQCVCRLYVHLSLLCTSVILFESPCRHLQQLWGQPHALHQLVQPSLFLVASQSDAQVVHLDLQAPSHSLRSDDTSWFSWLVRVWQLLNPAVEDRLVRRVSKCYATMHFSGIGWFETCLGLILQGVDLHLDKHVPHILFSNATRCCKSI